MLEQWFDIVTEFCNPICIMQKLKTPTEVMKKQKTDKREQEEGKTMKNISLPMPKRFLSS